MKIFKHKGHYGHKENPKRGDSLFTGPALVFESF